MFLDLFSVICNLEMFRILYLHVCLLHFSTVAAWTIKNDALYVLHERSSNVPHIIEVRLTQLQEKETKGPFMVHWHTHWYSYFISNRNRSIPYMCTIRESFGGTNWLSSLTLNARHRLVVSSPFTKDISYRLAIIRVCKLWRVAA